MPTITMEGKIRKWGNSYGILLSKEALKKKDIHENETVVVGIKKKKGGLADLFGIFHWEESMEEIMRDIREGYDE